MKRFLSILLALFMIAACALTMVACDKKDGDEEDKPKGGGTVEVNAPVGYTVWKNEDIGFAYPSSWTEMDYPGILLLVQDQLGNNLNVLSEAKNSVYSTVTNENFMEVMGPSYAMVGSTITSHNVSHFNTAEGVRVNKFTFKNTMPVSGVSVTVYQTQFYVNAGNKTYAITVTGRSNSEMLEIAGVVEDTLATAK